MSNDGVSINRNEVNKMEEILKIYNDGSHFVGTKFTRLPSDSNGDLEFNDDGELLVKASVNKGSTYKQYLF